MFFFRLFIRFQRKLGLCDFGRSSATAKVLPVTYITGGEAKIGDDAHVARRTFGDSMGDVATLNDGVITDQIVTLHQLIYHPRQNRKGGQLTMGWRITASFYQAATATGSWAIKSVAASIPEIVPLRTSRQNIVRINMYEKMLHE